MLQSLNGQRWFRIGLVKETFDTIIIETAIMAVFDAHLQRKTKSTSSPTSINDTSLSITYEKPWQN